MHSPVSQYTYAGGVWLYVINGSWVCLQSSSISRFVFRTCRDADLALSCCREHSIASKVSGCHFRFVIDLVVYCSKMGCIVECMGVLVETWWCQCPMPWSIWCMQQLNETRNHGRGTTMTVDWNTHDWIMQQSHVVPTVFYSQGTIKSKGGAHRILQYRNTSIMRTCSIQECSALTWLIALNMLNK